MKDIIIFGGGNEGKMFSNMVLSQKCLGVEQLNILYFCDNHIPMGTFVNGIKVINIYELKRLNVQYDIYICTEKYVDTIMKQLYEMGIKNDVYYVPPYTYKFKYNNTDMPFAVKMDIEKPRLPWLEIGIVHHCNMNCNGCSTCANISGKEFIEIEKFEKDLKRIKVIFSGIKILKLFGGEPLLHPDIIEIITCARKIFPDAKILVHSNGLLVPKCTEELLTRMNQLEIEFIFTLYPETGKIKRKIELCLQQANVEYEFTPPTYEFRKVINRKGSYDPEEVYSNCCKCISLIEDNLSCGFPYLIKRLEEKYDTIICEDKYQGCVNIYNTELTGWEINRLLDKPHNLCAYCAFMRFNVLDDDNEYFKWKREKPQLEDWII